MSATRSYVRKDPAEWEREGWSSYPNAIVRDPDLPWELRAVWCWMASHTETFEVNGDVLWKAGPAGRDKAYGFLRALEERGLLTRHYEVDDDGNPVIRYDLHMRPVPVEQRTARPSKAKPRRKFPKLQQEDTAEQSAPEVAPGADDDGFLTSQESPGQTRIPDRSGTGGSIPDRSGTDRAGIPYKEEKTSREHQKDKDLLPEPPAAVRDDVEALCARLRDRMIENGCKAPTITKAWRDEARRLLDIDGRELDKALNLIDWCQNDPFWKTNIHSMPKFRAQYDKLRMRALDEYRQQRGSSDYRSPTDERIAAFLNGPSITGRFASAWPTDDVPQLGQAELLALPGGDWR